MMLLTEGEEEEGQRESGVRSGPFNLTHSPVTHWAVEAH